MSNMPVFENPCGAYSRYEITKHIPLDRLEEICQTERNGRLSIGGIDWASGDDWTGHITREAALKGEGHE